MECIRNEKILKHRLKQTESETYQIFLVITNRDFYYTEGCQWKHLLDI